MVGPVLGPFVEESWNDTETRGSFWRRKEKYRQTRPYNLVAPYLAWEHKTLDTYGPAGSMANAHVGFSPWYMRSHLKFRGDPICEDCIARCRSRFVDKLGASAELATSLAERKQSYAMIAMRANQLRQTLKALKRGDFKLAAKTLAAGDPSKAEMLGKTKYSRSKSVANQLLEWHFGWSPLIQDIFNAGEVLSEPLPKQVRLLATQTVKFTTFGRDVQLYTTTTGQGHGFVRVRMGGTVAVSNPQLYLLNKLGLVNPASVAWEVIPWSFLADWLGRFGQFISQFTDFVGLDLSESWHSIRSEHFVQSSKTFVADPAVNNWGVTSSSSGFLRVKGLPNVTIGFKPLKGPSPTRAITAVSLLIQQLPRR